MSEVSTPIPANPAIKADGRSIREMKKKIHKQNKNPDKHKVVEHKLAKHHLIPMTSGSINRGGHRG